MATSPLRFAVVGAGMIGKLHARELAALPDVEPAFVFSRDSRRARSVGDPVGAEAMTDYDGLLARNDLDAVTICTASGEHAEFGIRAAGAGKHVLVEKPIDITLERADALIRACRENGVKLGVVFQLRFLDASMDVKRAVQSGALGKLVMCDCIMKFHRPQSYYDESRWKGTLAMDGGGALMNQGIHGLDLLLHLAGDIEAVKAYSAALAHDDIEVEDTCVAAVTFAGGALGVVQAATSVQPDVRQRIELHGTEGTIVLEGTEDTWIRCWETAWEKREPQQPACGEQAGAAAVLEHGGEGHRRQIADFADAIRQNREPAVNGEEGRRSLAVVQAIYTSASSGSETRPSYL